MPDDGGTYHAAMGYTGEKKVLTPAEQIAEAKRKLDQSIRDSVTWQKFQEFADTFAKETGLNVERITIRFSELRIQGGDKANILTYVDIETSNID